MGRRLAFALIEIGAWAFVALLALAFVLAGIASADPPERRWAEPTLTLTLPPMAGIHTWGIYRQDAVGGPWTLAATTTTNTATTTLPRCASVRYASMGFAGTENTALSDPAEWIAWCGDPDLNASGFVDGTDFSWWKLYYLRHRVGKEWK